MPPHELDVAELRPLISEQLEGKARSRVDGEGDDAREGLTEAVGEEDGVVGGGGEEVVAPGRDDGEVEMCDGAEGGGKQEEVARVASEREGGARGAFEEEELVRDEGEIVAGSGVGDDGEDVAEDNVRKVVHGGGGCGH